MTKVREIYRCQICGNVVEVVNPEPCSVAVASR